MTENQVKYAPGMRIIVRGEEWMVKKVETNSLEYQTLHVIGLSQLVKDYESMFLVDVEDDIEIVDPAKVTLVPDDSAFFRKSKKSRVRNCEPWVIPIREELYGCIL